MTEVDAIVLDIDGGAMLEQCLHSIRAQTSRASILVFDNGSKAPVSRRLSADIAVVRHETNCGFAAGVNAAWRRTYAPFVALINNDVLLDPDWLAIVLEAMRQDPKLAAVQTIIRRPDGLIDGAGIDISDGTFRQIGYGVELGTSLPVPWGVSATATLYRRAAVGDEVFDERLFAYYEDVALSARLRADGWRTAVLPVVKATHRGSQTAPALGSDALRLRTRNRYLVARRYGVGSISALLLEDARLLPRGRTSVTGLLEGLFGKL